MTYFNDPIVDELFEGYPLEHLDAGSPRKEVYSKLKLLTVEKLFGAAEIKDHGMAKCCLAGLWLWHNYLEESHKISQEVETSAGSAWHGLMHRREGDFGNANYWFARVRVLELFAGVKNYLSEAQAAALTPKLKSIYLTEAWMPAHFTNEVERIVSRGDQKEITAALSVATAEWVTLFVHCYSYALRPSKRSSL